MPDISVLLPCYNAAATLEETLISLQAQSFSDFEVLCVDDGSTDQTPAILKRWSKKDSRFVVVKKEHCGVIQAANTGLSLCQAPIIIRMDADDRCHPERIQLQREYLLEHPYPYGQPIVNLLYKYFDVDPAELERERRELLESLQPEG